MVRYERDECQTERYKGMVCVMYEMIRPEAAGCAIKDERKTYVYAATFEQDVRRGGKRFEPMRKHRRWIYGTVYDSNLGTHAMSVMA